MLDHYLEVFKHKPGAFAGSTALAQARLSGAFGPVHQAFYDLARRQRGDGTGTRAMCMVLLLHRMLPSDSVVAGMQAAIGLDNADPELVALEARRHHDASSPSASIVAIGAPFAERALPSLVGYDELLEVAR